MSKLADDPNIENAKKRIEEEKKVSDRSRAEYVRLSKGRPTPTQEENDLAMHGVHILEHDPDGSDLEVKQLEAERSPAKPYQTRQASAKSE